MNSYPTTLEPICDSGLLESEKKIDWQVQGSLKEFQLANCMDCVSADENKGTGIGCCTLMGGPQIKNNRCLSKYENISPVNSNKKRRDK